MPETTEMTEVQKAIFEYVRSVREEETKDGAFFPDDDSMREGYWFALNELAEHFQIDTYLSKEPL